MKRKVKFILLGVLLLVIIVVIVIIGYKYYRNRRYDKIKEGLQEDISEYLRITYSHCSKGSMYINEKALIYQYGMDKDKLLDVDGKSYCKVNVMVNCGTKNDYTWETYLKCQKYEDAGYNKYK